MRPRRGWIESLLLRMAPRSFRDSVYGDVLEELAHRRVGGARGPATWAPTMVLLLAAELLCARLAASLRDTISRKRGDTPRLPGSHRNGSMESIWKDVKLAGRAVRRAPGFALPVVAMLAIGIGATTAMYSLLEAALLRGLPYPDADELVMVWPVRNDRGPGQLSVANAEVFDVRNGVPSLDDVGAITYTNLTLAADPTPERLRVARVSAEVFDALGIEADHGRTFSRNEDAPGGAPVVVLSHELWTRRFGGDPGIVGTGIRLGEGVHTVVGVMPRGFHLPTDYGTATPSELWLPLRLNPVDPGFRGSKSLTAIVARLAGGAELQRVQQDLDVVARRIVQEHADNYPSEQGWSLVVRAPLEQTQGTFRPTLTLLMGAVGLMLSITCANVAHLALGRWNDRRGEIAVRQALGATRGRLIRQLLAESLALGVAGASVGVWLAVAALGSMRVALPADFPRLGEIAINGNVLGFAIAVTAMTIVGFGLSPAVAATRRPTANRLRDRTVAGGRGGAGKALVIAEVAVAVVLAVAGGLLLRTMAAYSAADPGFEPDGVITFGLSLPSSRYGEPAAVQGFYARLLEEIDALPAVAAAGATRRRPLADPMGTWAITIAGDGTDQQRPEIFPEWQVVTPRYFDALGLRLLDGRFFDTADDNNAPAVALVNNTMARAYWPGESALGKRLRLDGGPDNPWVTVVGVVGDVRHAALDLATPAKMYLPHGQYARISSVTSVPGMYVVVRTPNDPSALADALRATVWRLDPELPVTSVLTMKQIVANSLARPRLVASVLTALAITALAMAFSGLYSVLAAHVARRRREMGIRVALGADDTAIRSLVLGDGVRLAGIGLLLGGAGAWTLSRLIAGFLYSVEPTDPFTFVGVALLVGTLAGVASYVPARRAARVDPRGSIGPE